MFSLLMLRYFAATASPQRNDILRQVLAGRRRWTAAALRVDPHLFRANVVLPLRELKYEGIIPALSETQALAGDQNEITAVEIIGQISYPNGSAHGPDHPSLFPRVRIKAPSQ